MRAASQRLKTRMMTSSAAVVNGIATTLNRTKGSRSAAVGGGLPSADGACASQSTSAAVISAVKAAGS